MIKAFKICIKTIMLFMVKNITIISWLCENSILCAMLVISKFFKVSKFQMFYTKVPFQSTVRKSFNKHHGSTI